MPRISFSWNPDYNSDKKVDDVITIEASVEYSFEIPEGTIVYADDIHSHVDLWLAACGHVSD